MKRLLAHATIKPASFQTPRHHSRVTKYIQQQRLENVKKDEETWMDAISVNLFDPLSSQMRMDGGIPDVLIGRWMSTQLWL